MERVQEQFNHSVPENMAIVVAFSTLIESPPKPTSLSAFLEDNNNQSFERLHHYYEVEAFG